MFSRLKLVTLAFFRERSLVGRPDAILHPWHSIYYCTYMQKTTI